MRRRSLLSAMAASAALGAWPGPARAAPPPDKVPVPDDFAFDAEPLNKVRAAIGRRSLSLMTIGSRPLGHAMEPDAAGATPHPPPSYAAPLLARLSAGLPTVTVHLNVLPIARAEPEVFQQQLDLGLSRFRPDLVIWGAGGTAAARSDDLVSFHAQLHGAGQAVHGAGADMILMTPQFAPMLARLINLPPYRSAVLQEAEDANIPVLDRYDLMRFWSEEQILQLDSTKPEEQMIVARTVNDWIARLLTEGVLRAVA